MGKIAVPIVAKIRQSMVTLRFGNRNLGHGIVVSADGMILTKLANLKEGVRVTQNGKDFDIVRVLGVDRSSDLAILKIDASNLVPAEFATSPLRPGSLLITPLLNDPIPLIGSLCRTSEPGVTRGMLGIMTTDEQRDDGSPTVQVKQVVKGSPADKRGIRRGDYITAVDGNRIGTRTELVDATSQFAIDQPFEIEVLRNGVQQTYVVYRMESAALTGARADSSLRNMRTQFPISFQHDTKLAGNRSCGGPIVNLSGEIVGINVLGQHRGVDLYSRQPYRSDGTYLSNLCKSIPSSYIVDVLEKTSKGELEPERLNGLLLGALENERAAITEQIKKLKSANDPESSSSGSYQQQRTLRQLSTQQKLLDREIRKLRRGF